MKRCGLLVLSIFSMALLAACDSPPAATPTPAAPIADEDIAVPADFADEADTTINSSNYKGELDNLEKEVNAE